jgi:hypothetical protein
MDPVILLGAGLAVFIYITCILVFAFRLAGKPEWGHRTGYMQILAILPLVFLLLHNPRSAQPWLYALQVSLMICFLIVEMLLDYTLHVDFRSQQQAVIAYIMLFFAGTGGMLGVAALAGQVWTAVATALFLIMAVLAFVQRRVTGL